MTRAFLTSPLSLSISSIVVLHKVVAKFACVSVIFFFPQHSRSRVKHDISLADLKLRISGQKHGNGTASLPPTKVAVSSGY